MKISTILRWIAVPFSSIIGSVICYAIISLWIKGYNFGFYIYNGIEVGGITDIILALMAQAAFGAGFVFCGAFTAPSSQSVCSIVLATIVSILALLSLILSIMQSGFSILFLSHIFATIIGAIMAARHILASEPSLDLTNAR